MCYTVYIGGCLVGLEVIMEIGVYIEVQSEIFNMRVPLERRVTYLRGDSGVGKTTFVGLISSALNNEDPSINLLYTEGYSISIVTDLNNLEDIKNRNKSILVLDDTQMSERESFSNVAANILVQNDLYLLVISRVEMYDSVGIYKTQKGNYSNKEYRCDYTVGSILFVKKDGVNHIVSKLVNEIYDS